MPVKIATEISKKKSGRKTKSVLNSLLSFDQTVRSSYKSFASQITVIGIDEVGIGCLAGPVVAAAAILPPIEAKSKLAKSLTKLNDSKKIDHEIRKELAVILKEHAHFSIASASVEEIDEINILQAGLLAMKRAVLDLMAQLNGLSDVLLLIDGNKKIPQFSYEQMCVIQGDSQSASIAAASVIAKVFRDELMAELSSLHPEYLWHKNKGYGSSAHRQAISVHGLSTHHRRSFNCGILDLNIDE